MLALFR